MTRFNAMANGVIENTAEKHFEYFVALEIWNKVKGNKIVELISKRPNSEYVSNGICELALPKTAPTFDVADVVYELNKIIDRYVTWVNTNDYWSNKK